MKNSNRFINSIKNAILHRHLTLLDIVKFELEPFANEHSCSIMVTKRTNVYYIVGLEIEEKLYQFHIEEMDNYVYVTVDGQDILDVLSEGKKYKKILSNLYCEKKDDSLMTKIIQYYIELIKIACELQ